MFRLRTTYNDLPLYLHISNIPPNIRRRKLLQIFHANYAELFRKSISNVARRGYRRFVDAVWYFDATYSLL